MEAKKSSSRPAPIQSGRPTPRARESSPGRRSSSQAVAIEPRSCSSALRRAVGALGEREDRLGVDGHLRLGALEAVLLHQLVVVEDDPVVDADDGAVADRMVVGLDPRMALRVVADVEERLGRVRREQDLLEERAGAGALLVDLNVPAGAAYA